MRPMAAAAIGALISGVAFYAVGARAAQNNPFAEMPALVQTIDGRYIEVPNARALGYAPGYVAAPGYTAAPRATVLPAAAPAVVRQAPATRTVYRTDAPAQEEPVVVERSQSSAVVGQDGNGDRRVVSRRRRSWRPDGRQERGTGRRCDRWRRSFDIRGISPTLSRDCFEQSPRAGGGEHPPPSFFVRSCRCAVLGRVPDQDRERRAIPAQQFKRIRNDYGV